MSWVNYTWDNGKTKLGLIPHKTDMNTFRIIKIKTKHSCSECSVKLTSGMYCFGGGYTRLCLDCGEKFANHCIGRFEDIKNEIKHNLKTLEDNKDKWKTENVIASI